MAETSLGQSAKTMSAVMDQLYDGVYNISDTSGKRVLMKGDYVFNGRIELFDTLKKDTGLEYSLFFENTRVATTLKKNSDFMLGTVMDSTVWSKVHNGGNCEDVTINNKDYYAYYLPLKTTSGTLVGALGIAEPKSSITSRQVASLLPIIAVILILTVLTMLMILSYTKDLTDSIYDIRKFVGNIANEHFGKRLEDKTYKREDELGDIGRDITVMRNSLRDMIERDALTNLYNKNTGNKKLNAILNRCRKRQQSCAIAMGDIDFFKKVNDTYGHEAGDAVLRMVSGTIDKGMKDNGIAVRWGGEEFLMGFENKTKAQAVNVLEAILSQIRGTTVEYNGLSIQVTMTFGIVSGQKTKTLEELFACVDHRLYIGKGNGRNQIVREG